MLSTKLSSRKEGLCHPELLPKGSADLLTGCLGQGAPSPWCFPEESSALPPGTGWRVKGISSELLLLWMLGKPETLPRATHRGAWPGRLCPSVSPCQHLLQQLSM